jgi:hypothetical protein
MDGLVNNKRTKTTNMRPKRHLFLIIFSLFYISTSYCATDMDEYPWSAFFYVGKMTQNTLGSVLIQDFQFDSETLYSLELSRQLSPENALRHFLQPIVSTVEVAGNFTYRDDPAGNIFEFNPYLLFRWRDFPWDNVVTTSLGLGEGLSYDTEVPQIEMKNSDEAQRLLNYLMMEATFALPDHPQWELVWRIHHRSGVFGLYNSGNNGSTAIGLGIRYHF